VEREWAFIAVRALQFVQRAQEDKEMTDRGTEVGRSVLLVGGSF